MSHSTTLSTVQLYTVGKKKKQNIHYNYNSQSLFCTTLVVPKATIILSVAQNMHYEKKVIGRTQP